ncbi:MAG: acyltransferase [Candidatus Symbiothrix sp.]|nr:acyltransferase [Candidatus Symbiothrix sp.]
MEQFLKISFLTKYRTQLMGVAMLWVLFFHLGGHIPSFKPCGYGGVDLFLFLSGMGLFFSLTKNDNKINFYKKRIVRILPYYLPIVSVVSILVVLSQKLPISIVFSNIATLAFWLKPIPVLGAYYFDWYIPSLIVLYLITPLYFSIFKEKLLLGTLIMSVSAILISLLIMNSPAEYLLIFTTRIPIYFIGILIGYYIIQDIKMDTKKIVLLLFSFLIGSIWLLLTLHYHTIEELWKYGVGWYPFILITFPLLMILSGIMSLFKNYQFPILSFVGKYTLVLYLFHETIQYILSVFLHSKILLITISLTLTFIIAYFYQNIIAKMVDYLLKRGK